MHIGAGTSSMNVAKSNGANSHTSTSMLPAFPSCDRTSPRLRRHVVFESRRYNLILVAMPVRVVRTSFPFRSVNCLFNG